ncbi:hypothetical protein HQ560_18140, partial [bacterium]|nr:hypothetical protein [bacterium]
FTVGRGYVAGIMTPTIDSGDRVRYGRTPYALFRVKRGWNVGRVGVMVPGDSEMRDVPFRFDGTFIAVPMEAYTNCAVVRLFVTGRSRRRIGKGRFTGPMDSCGDPASSFVDIRER